MKINSRLKRSLIADVENMCSIDLDKETKEGLMRCFEITIACHLPVLGISENRAAYEFDKILKQGNEGESFRNIIDNLTDDQIREAIEEYAESKNTNHSK